MSASGPAAATGKARYIMIGGFLGAGKTTAVAQLARRLSDRGMRVGLITNDQGADLVDTAMLRSKGFATEEIAGGCFCCRFNSLVEAADRLTRSSRPDVFIAEPVGSCTDLVATVTYPLRRIYGRDFTVAPLSVLIDPVRALRLLGLEAGGRFSDKVAYIYRKQLEEADLLVLNKCDAVEPARLDALEGALGREFPGRAIRRISARGGAGLDAWFDQLLSNEQVARAQMEVDYDTYAEGEALLGWLNATARFRQTGGFDAEIVLQRLAADIQARLKAGHAEVAHLKMTLSPDSGLGDIAALNLVRNDVVPELSLRLDGPVESGQLILNLRAEADPARLRLAVEAALAALPAAFAGLEARLEHAEQFRPGRPVPTHREASGA